MSLLTNFLFLFAVLNIYSLGNQASTDPKLNPIDSLTAIINLQNPSKAILDYPSSFDSVTGEKIKGIEFQFYQHLSKYTITTNRMGTGMAIYSIELYLSNDTLIKATEYYSTEKTDFWKMFYYVGNSYYSMLASPRCLRISEHENGQEYIGVAKMLVRHNKVLKKQ